MSNLPAVKCKDWLLNGYKIQMLCEIQGAAECRSKEFQVHSVATVTSAFYVIN